MTLSTMDRARRQPIDRSGDRRVAIAGIASSLAFLAAAVVSLALPEATRRGLWLPLHLTLAGAASSAIAGVLPFFVAAFAAAPPASTPLRATSLIGVAAGAGAVTAGVVSGQTAVAVAGGASFVTGVSLVAAAAIQPVRKGLGPGRGIVTQAYIAGLAMVGAGGLLATVYVAGWMPVVEAWGRLRPAHAWLNLVGFVSLVIASTLIHFFPTVVGARIGRHRSGRVCVSALIVGPPLVAAGYASGIDIVVRAGASVAMLGALALVAYAFRTWRSRAHWTTDAGWHRFAIGGLASAIGWFVIGVGILGVRTFVEGSAPSGWQLDPVVGPLVLGWVALSILASATHLVPAVGPGDQRVHARQRQLLARAAMSRLSALDAGVAAISLGVGAERSDLALAGGALFGAAAVATLALLVRAISAGLRVRP